MKGTWFLFFVLTARLPFLERESMADGVHRRKKERGREGGLTCRQRNGGLAVLARGFQSFKS
ncbi:hypothetical protein PVAP13_2NG148872 [Panicum virgatum]|uniref:Uncharacterized protein n=1 Tax=Panicum virgatum TaxID=38727 RepID=A0A8T0VJW1_PANVG|nr:hypothetical protein PVAP13_2NG148872 [Panicum virgatum]